MCNWCTSAACVILGFAVGVVVGYENERAIDDMAYRARREKRNLEKKIKHLRQEYDM